MIDLKTVISPQEKVIWEGKPDKKCFILESIFNPLLPFALVWACIDIFVLGSFVAGGVEAFFIIPFMLLHMMPVWIYLCGIILSYRRHRNTYYIITDVGVYISGGTFSYSYDMKPWAELSNIKLHRGIFDQKIGVGDVIFEGSFPMMMMSSKGSNRVPAFAIINIKDYQEVFKLTKELQKDIHADTMYPNDLRPKENHGYNTNYRG